MNGNRSGRLYTNYCDKPILAHAMEHNQKFTTGFLFKVYNSMLKNIVYLSNLQIYKLLNRRFKKYLTPREGLNLRLG